MTITYFIKIKIISYRCKCIFITSILLSINFFIFKYSSCVNSKNLSLQTFIKYEQVLNIFVLSLICLLYSSICSFFVITIIGTTNSSHNFIAK